LSRDSTNRSVLLNLPRCSSNCRGFEENSFPSGLMGGRRVRKSFSCSSNSGGFEENSFSSGLMGTRLVNDSGISGSRESSILEISRSSEDFCPPYDQPRLLCFSAHDACSACGSMVSGNSATGVRGASLAATVSRGCWNLFSHRESRDDFENPCCFRHRHHARYVDLNCWLAPRKGLGRSFLVNISPR